MITTPSIEALLVSDFNIDILKSYLVNNKDQPNISVANLPYGQVMQILMNSDAECWQDPEKLVVIWTQAESMIPGFNDLINYKSASLEIVLKEVDEYANAIKSVCQKAKMLFLPTWVVPTYHRGYGILDMKKGLGVANTVIRMNLRLQEDLEDANNVYLLNTQKWIETVGKNAFNPKLWYLGKVPYDNEVFKLAALDIKAALRAQFGDVKKVILLDLDDTLWSGIVGEEGWENIKLGGHDPIGEALLDFQKTLKSFRDKGILLGLVSKNEENVALVAIDKHPEMVLGLHDFAAFRINWDDKARNIVNLMEELNIGLQSAVFIDNNPVERARVREALPEVFVPEWPEDKMLYKKALLSLTCFDCATISEEDLSRTSMYKSEHKRNQTRTSLVSLDEWLKTLEMKVQVEEMDEAGLQRTVQLLNKTNQMNLITRRMTDVELRDWADEYHHKLWTFRVRDKFGDYGLTGIVSVELNNNIATIIDFVLSCRVIGRKVEECMVFTAFHFAKENHIKQLVVEYKPTEKNKPCFEFWMKSGFDYDKKNKFKWDMKKDYAVPECISLMT
ncbi:MAG: HAD-IIIC family phosphatase [Candidatus Brocadiales bacterium]|nr:HAD-IIIC family phosphatase [Candidatus Brocadiales bacterium]